MNHPYLDTHCHLDAYFRATEGAEAARRADVEIIAVTNLPTHRQRLQARLPPSTLNVRVALGVHPGEAARMNAVEWRTFETAVANTDEIGEIGLDFSPGVERLVQERVFARVLSSLRDRPRFLTVHSRRAVRATLKHLASAGIAPVVFHWFSGSQTDFDAVLAAGHFFSVNTAMIASSRTSALIASLPHNRVLAESDGPFAKHRGKPAWPSDVRDVYAWLAGAWEADVDAVRRQLGENYQAVRRGEARVMHTPLLQLLP